MKLTTRLVAVTAGTVFLASALAGWLLVRMERQQLVADEVTESRVLARSLQVSVENALRDGQDPDIAELLGRLELIARRVDVLVFDPEDEAPRQASLGSVDDGIVRGVVRQTRGRDEVVELIDAGGGPPRLLLGVSLRTDSGDRIGTLVVDRPLLELQADMRATTALLAGAVLAFALCTTLVMLLLLRVEITRPLTRIAAATEVLGADLDQPMELPPQRSDELEAVRQTLLKLQGQLIRARDAQAAEAREREGLERQLREADKLIAVGQLAAGLAHEIGSPLQVLVGRAALLGRSPGATEDVRRQAGLIGEHAARIAAIVERLQDVARRRPSQITTFGLEHPVGQVMWLLEPEARARGVTLRFAEPPHSVRVAADADEVHQVALNLALNALQACAPGDSVDVIVQDEPDGPTLRVRDSGRGMDDAVLARVFEPFFTARPDGGGTGLGLAVVRSIADRHRAHVRYASTPGAGTEVCVTWPGGTP